MANEDILGGLKSALSRGYSLEEAMLSMYNAGYKRENIEDAARALQTQAPVQSIPSVQFPSPLSFIPQQKQQTTQPVGMQTIQKQTQQPIQVMQKPVPAAASSVSRVSKYSGYEARLRTISVILIILLAILLGILGVIFIFKQEIIQFFNSIF